SSGNAFRVRSFQGSDMVMLQSNAAAIGVTDIDAGENNDEISLSHRSQNLDQLPGPLVLRAGGNDDNVMRNVVVDVTATSPPLSALGPCAVTFAEEVDARQSGDTFTAHDSAAAIRTKYMLAPESFQIMGDLPRTFGGLQVDTSSPVETFVIRGGLGDDEAAVSLSASALPDVVRIEGGLGDNVVDVVGTGADERLVFGDGVPQADRLGFELVGITRFTATGAEGRDLLYNRSATVPGMLVGDGVGGNSNDILVNGRVGTSTGSEGSILLGGAGSDILAGDGNNVLYLADHTLDASGNLVLVGNPNDADVVRAGANGTVIATGSNDAICTDCSNAQGTFNRATGVFEDATGHPVGFRLFTDGARIDVCAWLLAIWTPLRQGGIQANALPADIAQDVIDAFQFPDWRFAAPTGGAMTAEGETPLQNPSNRVDVDNDGTVAPFDALLVVNRLNRSAGGAKGETGGAVYPDVNGDGQVTPLDVLAIVNYLNRQTGRDGEGEGATPVASNMLPSDTPAVHRDKMTGELDQGTFLAAEPRAVATPHRPEASPRQTEIRLRLPFEWPIVPAQGTLPFPHETVTVSAIDSLDDELLQLLACDPVRRPEGRGEP
ncbi:MAG: dockerin type I domain-containing protein, partial [Pirellulaceae bacterium]